MLTNLNLTDIETGYKAFRKEILEKITIEEKRFGIEPEITAKISKNKNIKIFEVPITINSRKYDEGKKVKWWHFFTYLYHIVKWRFIN